MSKIKKIISAFDLSEYSENAFHYACQISEDLKAELIVVNVLNQRDVDVIERLSKEYMDKLSVEGYIENQKQERFEIIDNLLKYKNNIQVRKIIKVGIPFVELVKTIEEEKADMVVMGTKGRSNILGGILGTTAEKMFRKCPVPLLSVRQTD